MSEKLSVETMQEQLKELNKDRSDLNRIIAEQEYALEQRLRGMGIIPKKEEAPRKRRAPAPTPAKEEPRPKPDLSTFIISLLGWFVALFSLGTTALQNFTIDTAGMPIWIPIIVMLAGSCFFAFLFAVFLLAAAALYFAVKGSPGMPQFVTQNQPIGPEWNLPPDGPRAQREEFSEVAKSNGVLDEDIFTNAYLTAIKNGQIGPDEQFSDFLARNHHGIDAFSQT